MLGLEELLDHLRPVAWVRYRLAMLPRPWRRALVDPVLLDGRVALLDCLAGATGAPPSEAAVRRLLVQLGHDPVRLLDACWFVFSDCAAGYRGLLSASAERWLDAVRACAGSDVAGAVRGLQFILGYHDHARHRHGGPELAALLAAPVASPSDSAGPTVAEDVVFVCWLAVRTAAPVCWRSSRRGRWPSEVELPRATTELLGALRGSVASLRGGRAARG